MTHGASVSMMSRSTATLHRLLNVFQMEYPSTHSGRQTIIKGNCSHQDDLCHAGIVHATEHGNFDCMIVVQ